MTEPRSRSISNSAGAESGNCVGDAGAVAHEVAHHLPALPAIAGSGGGSPAKAVVASPGDDPDLVGPEADTLVVDKPLSLPQLVEDELFLALPMYPAHPEGQCPAAIPGRKEPGKGKPVCSPQRAQENGSLN